MVVDRQEGDEMEATGLSQGSAVSPILFAIYIAEVHEFVGSRVPGVRALSFADDVTWLVVGEDVGLSDGRESVRLMKGPAHQKLELCYY